MLDHLYAWGYWGLRPKHSVVNILYYKALGGNGEMAEYTTRYINNSIEAAIDRAIAKLNPSQFATKLDMQSMEHRLLKWQIGIAVAIITTNLSVTFAMLKLMLGH